LVRISILLLFLFAPLDTACSQSDSTGCGSDKDCKGDRVCVHEECVNPASSQIDMKVSAINLLMPEETKSTLPRIPRRSKSKLQELRSAKADGPEDHIERIKELKDEWKKNQKNKVIVADLAAALVGFEERYPGVYASQQKLVGKVAKAVIKPVTFKEHQLGVRKLIIDKKYPEALKTLKAVMDAPEYDVKADDNYLRARIARLTNDNRNAIKYYMKVINEVPNYEAAAYDLAQIYLDLKQYAKAQELFLELRKNMKHSGSRLGMGIVDLSMKKASEDVSSETEINLNDALAISRKVGDKKMQFQIHRVRADLYRRQGKTDQQLADLQLVLGLKPGNEESAIALAEIYQKKGQGPDTLKTLKTCKKNGCKSAKFIAFYVTKLYEVEQPREAGAELNSGLELYPKDPQLLELKAEKAYQAKNLLNAIQLYEKLKEFHPTYEPSYLKLAKLLDEDGKSDQAVRVLEQGIERVHDKMSLMEKAARFHAKKGNNQKAKEYFEQILKEDPGRADLKLRFAILLKELGNDKDAYKYFKELAETNSLSPKQEITYAEVLHKLGKLKEATEVLDCEGKSLDKKRSAASEIRCGVLRTTSGDYEKADTHLSKSLALESSDRAYYYIGMNELARRSYEVAAQNLKRAVFLNKKALDAKVGLARALRHLGGTDNLQKAMIHLAGVIDTYSRYRTPLEMNSRDPEAYLQRGVLYLQAKEEQRAIADFDQGLSLDPNHADLTVAKAKALYYARQTKVATELLKKLIKREPKHAGAHFYLGRMYNATGLTVRSATHFSKCLKYADKTFAQVHEAHQSLANLYKEMKQNSKACEHMKQYLRTAPDNVSDRFDVADEVRKNCVR
jgi:tetratricopeptide (TPR) repeat protein